MLTAFDQLQPAWRTVLFDEAPTPMALVAPDHRFVRSNDSFCTLVGWSRSELTQRTWQSITHPDDVAGDQAGADKLKSDASSDTYTVTKRYLHKSGESVWVHLHVRALWNKDTFSGYFVTARPVHRSESSVVQQPPAKFSLWEWIRQRPADAILVGGALSVIFGRDTVLEILKALLLK